MTRKDVIIKVRKKLAFKSRKDLMELLSEIKGVRSPSILSNKIHSQFIDNPLSRSELIVFLGMAKQMGIFKEHFKIPEMEKTWRRWVDAQEPGLSNKFRFES